MSGAHVQRKEGRQGGREHEYRSFRRHRDSVDHEMLINVLDSQRGLKIKGHFVSSY